MRSRTSCKVTIPIIDFAGLREVGRFSVSLPPGIEPVADSGPEVEQIVLRLHLGREFGEQRLVGVGRVMLNPVQKNLGDIEDMIGEFPVGARPVGKHLIQFAFRELGREPECRGQDSVDTFPQNSRRQHPVAAPFEAGNPGDIAKDGTVGPVITPRNDGYEPDAQFLQLGKPNGVLENVDGYELNPFSIRNSFGFKQLEHPVASRPEAGTVRAWFPWRFLPVPWRMLRQSPDGRYGRYWRADGTQRSQSRSDRKNPVHVACAQGFGKGSRNKDLPLPP